MIFDDLLERIRWRSRSIAWTAIRGGRGHESATPRGRVSHHALPDGRVLALVNVQAMLTDLPSTGFDDQLDALVDALRKGELARSVIVF